MIRVESKDGVFAFICAWKAAEVKFGEVSIRATSDKPPQQRKSNGKICSMAPYLRSKFQDAEVDPDFRNSSV